MAVMVIINQEKCMGCGTCAGDCVAGNIVIKENKAVIKRECVQCGHCVAICPLNAVSIPEYDMADVETYCPETFDLKPENVLHNIKFRRSIRSYKEKKVEREVLEKLLQAGRYTATAHNNQNCHFVVVQDNLVALKFGLWKYIEILTSTEEGKASKKLRPYAAFHRRWKENPNNDFLFRNASTVLFITSDWTMDAGLAAQNIETMAVSMKLGVLYNDYLASIVNESEEMKKWLGIEGKEIRICMLLGYPDRTYVRTAPRKEANIIWK